MSEYTTQLRWIVEQTLVDQGADPMKEANWPLAYDKIGLADYPIFDEAHRTDLNDLIIRHYYTRQIGAETAGRFRMFVRDAMHLIMPYYNQLYESEALAAQMEPLVDTNVKTTEKAFGDSSNTSESSGTGKGTAVYQDTPSSKLNPDEVRELKYATDVNVSDDSTTANASANAKYQNTLEKDEKGHSRSQSELLNLYRTTILNIDRMIVEDVELAQCFLGLWKGE